MTRILFPLVLLAAIGGASVRPQAPAERGAARLLIDAVAFDGKGAQVLDLKPEEMEVWIGHYRVPIETFAALTPANFDRPGRLIILVLDDVALPVEMTPRARDVARRFVNRMSPGDHMAIVTLNGASMESTDDRTRLLRSIDAYNVRAGLMRIDTAGEHVLKTIAALSRQLAEAPEQRKTIVAIGAAGLLDRPIPPPQVGHEVRREWIDAMQAMASANVNLYVIDPGGVGMSRVDGGSSGFARETGGLAFVGTNDLNGAADRVMREAANYYLIGVADPPNGRGADLRDLEVRALRPGISIRARRAVIGGR
jgi:VWFA-related protein